MVILPKKCEKICPSLESPTISRRLNSPKVFVGFVNKRWCHERHAWNILAEAATTSRNDVVFLLPKRKFPFIKTSPASYCFSHQNRIDGLSVERPHFARARRPLSIPWDFAMRGLPSYYFVTKCDNEIYLDGYKSFTWDKIIASTLEGDDIWYTWYQGCFDGL